MHEPSSGTNCVVLDIGSLYTRCGFIREFVPESIIYSKVQDSWLWKYISIEDFSEKFSDFLHKIYLKKLLINANNRKLVLVESLFTSEKIRQAMAKILFIKFEVSSVCFIPSHLAATFPYAVSTALVIDIGFEEASVIPIVYSTLILPAYEALPLAGKAVNEKLNSLLIEHASIIKNGKSQPFSQVADQIDMEMLEDIKVRSCCCTTFQRSRRFYSASSNDSRFEEMPSICFPYKNNFIIKVPGIVREMAMEILFEKNIDGKSLATMLLDSILKCSIEVRRELASNIIIVGGTALSHGFRHRLKEELNECLENEYADKLPFRLVKFHKELAKSNIISWIGGSILGSLPILEHKSISRETFHRNNDTISESIALPFRVDEASG